MVEAWRRMCAHIGLWWVRKVARPQVMNRSRLREPEPYQYVVQTGPFPWSLTHTTDLDEVERLRAPAMRELARLARIERELAALVERPSPW
jgi:hypothetical protein